MAISITREQQQALIDAANLLHEFCSEHLPLDYEICLSLSAGESSLQLFGPDGEEIEVSDFEHEVSAICSLCDWAQFIESGEPPD